LNFGSTLQKNLNADEFEQNIELIQITLLEEMMQKLNHNYEVSYTAICKTKCEIY
jgi:hypothetical protein